MDELIAVVGMHRSGTSLAAHVVHELGVTALGAHTSMVPSDAFNPRGYWESADLVMVNTYLCNFLGCDWRHPALAREGWHRSRRLGPLRRRLGRLLAQTPPGRRSLKDPRLTMTLPFWQSLVAQSATVLCLRSPASVADSLDRREHMDRRWALGLWTMHTAMAILNARARRRMFVVYEDVLADPVAQAERLAAFVGVGADRAAAAAAATVLPYLCHSEPALDDGSAVAALGPEGARAAGLWRAALGARAGGWRAAPLAALEAAAAEAVAAPPLRPPALSYQRRHRLRFLVKTLRLVASGTARQDGGVALPSGRALGPIRRIERPEEY